MVTIKLYRKTLDGQTEIVWLHPDEVRLLRAGTIRLTNADGLEPSPPTPCTTIELADGTERHSPTSATGIAAAWRRCVAGLGGGHNAGEEADSHAR